MQKKTLRFVDHIRNHVWGVREFGVWGHPPHTQVCCSGFNNEWVIFAQPWVRQNDDTHIVVIKNKHRKHPFLPTTDGGPNGWGWISDGGIVTLYRGLLLWTTIFSSMLINVDPNHRTLCIRLLYTCIHNYTHVYMYNKIVALGMFCKSIW